MDRADLSADEFTAAVSSLANAFGDPTRREVYLYLKGAGGRTSTEVAEHFELHPNVARHHLDKLAAGGYLHVDLAKGESAGRPSKRYQVRETLTGTAVQFPPRRDNLLATLLARSLQMLPPDEATAMAEEVGYDYGKVLAARMEPSQGHRSVRAAVSSVADALTAHGFAAHAESKDGSLQIVSEQCPFGEAAQQFPHVVCAVDRGMIKGMLAGLYGETNPQFAASRPAGDAHCVTCV